MGAKKLIELNAISLEEQLGDREDFVLVVSTEPLFRDAKYLTCCMIRDCEFDVSKIKVILDRNLPEGTWMVEGWKDEKSIKNT